MRVERCRLSKVLYGNTLKVGRFLEDKTRLQPVPCTL